MSGGDVNAAAETRRELMRMPKADIIAAFGAALNERDALVAEVERRDAIYEALCGIANADTKYPSMPSGFTGNWRVLRDEARAVLSESEDGVWE